MIKKSATVLYEVLDLEQSDKWNEIVRKCEAYDTFFLPGYFQMYQDRGEGKAKLFVFYHDENQYVAYPFLLRKINIETLLEQIDYYDITTPYGYGGPLYSNPNLVNNTAFINKFRECFDEYCQSQGIVSEFVRFHPYLKTQVGLDDYLSVSSAGRVVYNDLSVLEDEIWPNIASSKKRRIKKSKRLGVVVEFIDGNDIKGEHIEKFHKIYTDTMNKKNASNFYFFSLEFFTSYFASLKENITLSFALYGDKVIAANLLLTCRDFVSIHLSCSDKNHLHMCPNCNLRYECILWSREHGYKLVDHGGGKEKRDSLFRYKEQFSNSLAEFYIGKKIHNDEIYIKLALKVSFCVEGESAAFFPEYRM